MDHSAAHGLEFVGFSAVIHGAAVVMTLFRRRPARTPSPTTVPATANLRITNILHPTIHVRS